MKRPREDLLDIGPPLKKTLLAKRQAGSIDMNPGTSVAATNSDLLPDSAGILALTPEMLLDRKMTPRVSCTDLTEKARVNIGQKTNVGRVNQRLMHDIIRNSHPTSETRSITTECETIVVERRGSNGDVQHRTIKLMCSPDVPDNIIMNKQYLKFSLHKILDNAFKFTESGNITSSVRIDARRKMLEVSVEDTGCGITVESQQHLFEAHFQQDSAINRARDGLGLSLFNAKAQVRKYLGGDIVLERSSTFGRDKGSGFLMRLPMTIHQIDGHPAYFIGPSDLRTGVSTSILPELTAAPPLSTSSIPGTDRLCLSPSAASGTSKSSKKRRAYNPQLAKSYPLNFLVAEDNDIIRAIAISSLKKLGYDSKNITIAVDGVEAVNRYEASLSTPTQPRYTAILMDIWMPRVDGYEASRRIMKLAQQHGETTTIMAVTADITESCVERAKAAGMSGFLAKPYMLLDLECLIVDNFPHMGKPATET